MDLPPLFCYCYAFLSSSVVAESQHKNAAPVPKPAKMRQKFYSC